MMMKREEPRCVAAVAVARALLLLTAQSLARSCILAPQPITLTVNALARATSGRSSQYSNRQPTPYYCRRQDWEASQKKKYRGTRDHTHTI